MQKLFKQLPADNAIKEVNNLLATIPLLQIKRQDITAIEQSYNISLLQEYSLNLEEFYAVYLGALLSDKVFTAEESGELQHLQNILGLDAAHCQQLREKIGAAVYRKAFEEAVAGRRLSKESADGLTQLAMSLQLPSKIAEAISLQARQQPVDLFVNVLRAKARLSPLDEQELSAMSGSLGINVWAGNEQNKMLSEWKQYWQLENLPLPVIQTSVPMQKGEVCYLESRQAKWYEGSKLVDTGTLCLTNKRILLAGLQKNSNVRLEKITDIKSSGSGVLIMKDAGKNPTLFLPGSMDIFMIVLNRLVVEFK